MTNKMSNKDFIEYLNVKINYIAKNYKNPSKQKVINSTKRMINYMQKYNDYYLFPHPESYDPFYNIIFKLGEGPPNPLSSRLNVNLF